MSARKPEGFETWFLRWSFFAGGCILLISCGIALERHDYETAWLLLFLGTSGASALTWLHE